MWSQSVLLCFIFIGPKLLFSFVSAEPCPELYLRYSAQHTYCLPPNKDCDIVQDSVKPESIRIILKEHNKFRSRIAMGEEEIGQLLPAADMLQMEWDNNLAEMAQKHADQCKFEHDCGGCRRIRDFEVGQNLFMRYVTGSVPSPSWRAAVKAWYDEVVNFNRSFISPFDMSNAPGVIGHFTQVVWAKSWRVGCGYTVFKEGDIYKELYTCNYGPAGNMVDGAMYEVGEPCSDCPLNSCCGETCPSPEYSGLCRITDDSAPEYKPKNEAYIISACNFEPQSECPVETPASMKQWTVTHTLSGSYIGVVLEGGQSTALNVTKIFSSNEESCLTIHYRKGPNLAGEESASIALQEFVILNSETREPSTFITIPLINDAEDFMKFDMNLEWISLEFLMSISLSVPDGKPAQYFELRDLTYTKGKC